MDKINFRTDIYENGIIEQSLIGHSSLDGIKCLSKWVMDTQDKNIRDALIKLGWKPPEKKKNLDCQGIDINSNKGKISE